VGFALKYLKKVFVKINAVLIEKIRIDEGVIVDVMDDKKECSVMVKNNTSRLRVSSFAMAE